ncbi:MAG: SMI1/KNR4 family protein [Pseudomonadales bacterium]|nr:SMI1/KNR4 family protein [Pseudomonadales bacterium]
MLLKQNNGQSNHSIALFDGYYFLSSVQIIEKWTKLYKLLNDSAFKGKQSFCDAEINNSWWNSYWMPIASNKRGDCICIDMSPSSHDKLGQIISVLEASGKRTLCSNSFIEWFEGIGNKMEIRDEKIKEVEGC